jgi:hypothetical protein
VADATLAAGAVAGQALAGAPGARLGTSSDEGARGRQPGQRLCGRAWHEPAVQLGQMQYARDRIHELTARERLRVPVEQVVQDVNRFLRGWAGYFRRGNSTHQFDKIRSYAIGWQALFVAKRTGDRARTAGGWSCTPPQTSWV